MPTSDLLWTGGAVTHVAPSTPGPHMLTSKLSARGPRVPGGGLGGAWATQETTCWGQKHQSWDLPKGFGPPRARPRQRGHRTVKRQEHESADTNV